MAEHDDPFKRPEASILRPRPGGRRGAPEAARARAPFGSPERESDPIPAEARALLGLGLNPLVQAASPLLLLAGQLRGSLSPIDIPGLRQHAMEEMRRFEDQARASGVPSEVMMAARYALCAALDEAVLSTPWGAQSEWAQHPLLVALHREAWGGEKFFDMLDRISADPRKFIDLMELQYLCLAVGFAGKYQVADRGHEQLAEIQQSLARKIRTHREPGPAELSLRWRGLEDRRNPVIRHVPWWVVAAGAVAMVALAFVYFYTSLARTTAPVHAALAGIGLEDFSPAVAAAPARGPTLRELLAGDQQNGTVGIDEQGGRTVVTLLAPNLFASGSATITPGNLPALQRIAAALNRVPGRVLVVGHTDDQPVRSLRYQDNFELSRERAVSVVAVLKETLETDARISWTGVGASEPRYTPPSTSENRARNRRVEIVHVRGS